MSNTYFKIKKKVTTEGFGSYPDYTNKYKLTLTAFVGKSDNIQLTIQTRSTLESQSGIAYITLNEQDVDNLIKGLLERKEISATGYEQSKICSNDKPEKE